MGMNEYGKPFLARYGNIHFNLSHAGQWVAAVVSNKPVGVDVEKMEPIDALSIARRFFAEPECNDLLHLRPEQRLSGFNAVWTMKESYVKLRGTGLHLPLRSFYLRRAMDGDGRLHEVRDDTGTLAWCRNVPLEDGYKLAVCSYEIRQPQVLLLDGEAFKNRWLSIAYALNR